MKHNQAIVLDSFALMSYLGSEPGIERVKDLLSEAKATNRPLLLCVINLGEILYMTERRRGLVAAQEVQALIERLPILLFDADRQLVLEAAHVKANYAISYADAFVVALARREDGVILTGDPEFKTVETVVEIEWLPS